MNILHEYDYIQSCREVNFLNFPSSFQERIFILELFIEDWKFRLICSQNGFKNCYFGEIWIFLRYFNVKRSDARMNMFSKFSPFRSCFKSFHEIFSTFSMTTPNIVHWSNNIYIGKHFTKISIWRRSQIWTSEVACTDLSQSLPISPPPPRNPNKNLHFLDLQDFYVRWLVGTSWYTYSRKQWYVSTSQVGVKLSICCPSWLEYFAIKNQSLWNHETLAEVSGFNVAGWPTYRVSHNIRRIRNNKITIFFSWWRHEIICETYFI